MKYQKGDIVKIKNPQMYGHAQDTTSDFKNSWTEEMDGMDGMEICIERHTQGGWQISHNGLTFGLLEDWLQPVGVKGNSQDAYDRAMSIL